MSLAIDARWPEHVVAVLLLASVLVRAGVFVLVRRLVLVGVVENAIVTALGNDIVGVSAPSWTN